MKSSSVHCDFRTRKGSQQPSFTAIDEVAEFIDREVATDSKLVSVWTWAFRGTLCSDERMCPCAVLGAVSRDLQRAVAMEVRRFFKVCLDKMMATSLSESNASGLLATITDALVIAYALNEVCHIRSRSKGTGAKARPGHHQSEIARLPD